MTDTDNTIPKIEDVSVPINADTGRLALLLAELQSEVSNLNKGLAATFNRLNSLDQACANRLEILEQSVGIKKEPQNSIPPVHPIKQ